MDPKEITNEHMLSLLKEAETKLKRLSSIEYDLIKTNEDLDTARQEINMLKSWKIKHTQQCHPSIKKITDTQIYTKEVKVHDSDYLISENKRLKEELNRLSKENRSIHKYGLDKHLIMQISEDFYASTIRLMDDVVTTHASMIDDVSNFMLSMAKVEACRMSIIESKFHDTMHTIKSEAKKLVHENNKDDIEHLFVKREKRALTGITDAKALQKHINEETERIKQHMTSASLNVNEYYTRDASRMKDICDTYIRSQLTDKNVNIGRDSFYISLLQSIHDNIAIHVSYMVRKGNKIMFHSRPVDKSLAIQSWANHDDMFKRIKHNISWSKSKNDGMIGTATFDTEFAAEQTFNDMLRITRLTISLSNPEKMYMTGIK